MSRWLVLVAMLAGCSARHEPPAPTLERAILMRLAERDRALSHFALEGQTRTGAQVAQFQFNYLAPDHLLARVTSPVQVTYAYDGTHLFERDERAHRLTTYSLSLSDGRRAIVLRERFTVFVPVGFRAPELSGHAWSAARLARPGGGDAVRITVNGTGSSTEVATYELRWPSLDFLRSNVTGGAGDTAVEMTAEQCDAPLRLCVPTELRERSASGETSTRITRVELHASEPAATFALAPQPGETAVAHALVDAP